MSGDPCAAQDLHGYLSQFFPRIEASEGEEALYDFLDETLTRLDIEHRTLRFDETDIGHSFSRCMVADIPGGREDTLIVCVPLGHPLEAKQETSGTVNIEIALRVLGAASRRPLPISLKVLFLGAEHGQEQRYPMGSRLFLENFFPNYPVSVLYLNLRTVPSRLLIECGADGVVSPNWLLETCSSSLQKTAIPFLILGNENQFYRMGISEERTVLEPYLSAGYPAVALTGRYGGAAAAGTAVSARGTDITGAERREWLAAFTEFLLTLIDEYGRGMPTRWDRHYLFFQLTRYFMIVPETVYLGLFVVVLVLTLLYIQVFSTRFFGNIAAVILNLWFPLLLLALWFGFLLLSTRLLQAILWIRNSPALWRREPVLFLALKLALSAGLFVFVHPLLRRLPHPKQPRFFASTALFVLLLNIAILTFINISFTYYFLWAYFCIFLFTLFRTRWIKVFFLAASPFWIVKAAVDMFTIPKLAFCGGVLLSPYWGNLLLAIICLPYLLLLLSLIYLFPASYARQFRTRLFNTVLLAVSSLSLVGYLLLFRPYSVDEPQQVQVTNVINPNDDTNRIEVTSPNALGRFYYWRGGEPLQITTNNRRYVMTEPTTPDLLEVERSSTRILDRRNVELVFRPDGRPFDYQITVSAEEDFILFDSNFPFVRETDEETGLVSYRILIGKNPPRPLPVLLTLPTDRYFSLFVRMEYTRPPFQIDISGPFKDIDLLVRVEQRLDIRT